jgi:uncharacterized membrane protein YkvA (DUF1232 family)
MNKWRARVRRLRIEVHAVWLAARDPRTPLPARLLGLGLAAYALSPIDLIPDFVPILGLLDDLVLLPLGLWLFMRMVPAWLFAVHRAAAEQAIARPVSRTGAVMIVMLWLGLAGLLGLYLWSWRYW